MVTNGLPPVDKSKLATLVDFHNLQLFVTNRPQEKEASVLFVINGLDSKKIQIPYQLKRRYQPRERM